EEFFADQQGVDEMQASVRGGQLQADAAPAPILPGREILEPIVPERYELLGEVGRGGMGIVYRARHKGLDRPVDIKITLPDSPPERFLREAQLLAKVKSPYVVTVHDFDVLPNGCPLLVMEWVEGTNLYYRIHAGSEAPTEEEVTRWMRHTCEGMLAAADQGII